MITSNKHYCTMCNKRCNLKRLKNTKLLNICKIDIIHVLQVYKLLKSYNVITNKIIGNVMI